MVGVGRRWWQLWWAAGEIGLWEKEAAEEASAGHGGGEGGGNQHVYALYDQILMLHVMSPWQLRYKKLWDGGLFHWLSV
jgi:hypothetical protein